MCSLLQIWMQKSIWWWLISCRSVAEPWSLSATSKAVPHSWTCCFCLFPWQNQGQLPRQTQLQISPETRRSESPSLCQSSRLPSQHRGGVEIQQCCDSPASLWWPVPWLRVAVPAHLGDTHPQTPGPELCRCWQTLACSFHAFQGSLIVLGVPEKHRMILTLCYPFFTTESGLRVHTLVSNRNWKLL